MKTPHAFVALLAWVVLSGALGAAEATDTAWPKLTRENKP